jgi:CheY-like chemotaxis protein
MRALNILLAEDNRGDILLVRESLREHQIQHELHVVNDAQAAIEYLRNMGRSDQPPRPDLLLLDLNLPKGDGSDVLSELRRHPECAGTPVIVVTSSDSARERRRITELGISYYFRKPTEYEEYMQLGAIVRQVLESVI